MANRVLGSSGRFIHHDRDIYCTALLIGTIGMRCWATKLGIALAALESIALSFTCSARAQEQVSTVSERATDESGGAKVGSEKSADNLEPILSPGENENSVGLHLLKNIAEDQKALWIGPKSIRFDDADWLVPLGGATAAMLVTDTDLSKHLSNSPNRIKYSKDLSNYGLASIVGIGGGLYVLGHLTHDDHKIETGILAGEAAIDSLVPVYGMKYALGRERPLQGNYRGQFLQQGVSFPSEHAAAAWSIASVIAHEYPGPLTSLFAYGLASGISASRITAKQHFPSDVLIGSAIGWLEGMYVYRKHHNPELGGGEWETYVESQEDTQRHRGPGSLGSPYVPLDSWIYPSMERLAGMGLLNDEFMGMRPWTRSECARLVADAGEKVQDPDSQSSEASQLIAELQREFRPELDGIGNDGSASFRLESVYSRTEHISGMPLTDGYDFGQTQFNDFGRPYAEGWSTVSGFSAYATRGRWVSYFRGELQTAPSLPAFPLSTRELIAGLDLLPLQPGTPQAGITQFELMDSYVGLMVSNWQISFGRQSLWWGTGEGTSLDLSNNAQPIDMLRITRTTGLKLPSFLGWLGPVRTEFFIGRLSGYEFIFSPLGLVGQWGQALTDQPFIHGQNISFKPTRNFEFGFYRTTIFSGEGYPFTTHALISSLFNTGNAPAGTADKPGKRTSGLDLSYRLPGLRDRVTLYADGLTYDEYSPIAYPTWSAWHAGLYFSRLPKLPKVDLRFEGVYTDVPKIGGVNEPGTFYFNGTWRSGYTNNGNIMGSWVGRGGQGAQAWTNYWFGSRSRLQFNFRHEKISQEFIPGGGTLSDFGVRGDYWVCSYLGFSSSVQYERWLFPAIQPNVSTNLAAYVKVMFQPQKVFQRSGRSANKGELDYGGLP
jgi:Capsule assembly protein Wzi/PAP2 superfamily